VIKEFHCLVNVFKNTYSTSTFFWEVECIGMFKATIRLGLKAIT